MITQVILSLFCCFDNDIKFRVFDTFISQYEHIVGKKIWKIFV